MICQLDIRKVEMQCYIQLKKQLTIVVINMFLISLILLCLIKGAFYSHLNIKDSNQQPPPPKKKKYYFHDIKSYAHHSSSTTETGMISKLYTTSI